MVLSLSTVPFTYAVWLPCTPPLRLVRSPPCDGTSVASWPAGVCRFQNPLNVTLNVCPLLELGGVKSRLPNTEPLSLKRLLGTRPPTVVGTPSAWRPSSRC